MLKRLLSLALALLMTVGVVSVNAFAFNEPTDEVIELAGADGVDEGAVLTIFDEPITATFGTATNLLPESYTSQLDGQYGLTMILRFEGTKDGTIFGKILPRVTNQVTVTDENGEEVKKSETAEPFWVANWVYDGYNTNSYVLSGDGYYLYYFPYRNVKDSWSNTPSVADVTKLESFTVFDGTGALSNNRAALVPTDANMSVTLIGILEGSISQHDIYAYNKQTGEYDTVTSPVTINGESNSNSAQWRKLPDYTELFGINFGAGENEYVSDWVNREGEAIEDLDLAVKIVDPVYSTYEADDLVNVTFNDAQGEELATVLGLKGVGTIESIPDGPEKATDGIREYEFAGWSIDGENVIDPVFYAYEEDTTLVPVYNVYGKIYDTEPVVIGDGSEVQELLTDNTAKLKSDATGITLVYKVDGAEEEIIADGFIFATKQGSSPSWQWCDMPSYNADGQPCYEVELNNGYYFMYINANLHGAIDGLHSVMIFAEHKVDYHGTHNLPEGTQYRTPVNNNENATFQMLAVTQNNLQPTVTFHGTDGEVLTTYTYKYTDINRKHDYKPSPSSCIEGVLATPADIFAAAQAAVAEGEAAIEAPVKESDIAEVEYVLDGWTDAQGNVVDVVYMNGDLYPHFKVVDNRTQYNVVFKNYDGTVLYETVVPEGETPEYPESLPSPKKPSTDTNSYQFKGWEPVIGMMPVTPEADGATAPDTVVYTAKYDEIERRYDVIYYAEDGQTMLDEDLYIVKGEASSTDVVPTKDADVQYTYTFEKWVDLDGKDVDLTKVTADLKVKPAFKGTLNKYTVTFLDEDGKTELGKSTVDYGTAAAAPEATKEADEWYTYELEMWVDAEGNEVNITEVKGDVTVIASYKAIFVNPYPEEPVPNWGIDAVEYVLVNGIMNGMDGGFKPDVTMSRAMVVTVLFRYMDEPEADIPEDFVNFTDNADSDSWYYDAVIWGAVNGVVNGRGNGKFDPNGDVTREEFVTILYRFADQVMGEYMGYGRSTLSYFADREEISDWAHTAVKWAYASAEDLDTQGSKLYNKTQYITGMGFKDDKAIFAPKANATRAQVAVMLYRYMIGERISK